MADRNLRISMLLEASDRFTRPLRNLAGGARNAAGALKQTGDELKSLKRQQADVASFRKMGSELLQTRRDFAAAQTKVAALAREEAAAEAPSRKLTASLRRAREEVTRLAAAERKQVAELRDMRTQMRDAGIEAGKIAAHERRLREAVDRTTRSFEDQARAIRVRDERASRFRAVREGATQITDKAAGVAASGAGSIGVAVAVGGPIMAAAQGAMSLEEGMAGVAKVTGMAREQLATMQDRLITLSTKIPMTSVELSNIAAAAGAAGIGMDKFGKPLPSQANDLVAFTDAAARMGIAFDMSAEDAGSTMAKWRQAFQLPQRDVEALGDRINALTNKFGGKAADVSEIVTRIGPLGKVAGIAAPQIAALGSTLNSIGVENEIAATGIKNTLLALTKGSAATKSQIKAFEALGLSATDVSRRMQMDASGTIVDVFERLGKLSPDRQASMLDNLFGSESIGAIAPLLTNLDGLRQRLGLVGDRSRYAGSMTAEFLSRINTTTGATDLAANGFQAVNTTLGQALLPTIKAGAQRFAAFAARTREWARANPALAKAAMFVGGGLAALFAILGVGAFAVAGIMAPIAIANAGLIAMGVAGGVASIGLLPIIGTVAAVVAGVSLLGTAAYLIYSKWAGVGAFFSGLWSGITSVFSISLLDIWKGVAYLGGYVIGALWNVLKGIYNWFTNDLGPAVVRGWNAAWSGLSAVLTADFETIRQRFLNFGKMVLDGLWSGIANAPDRLWKAGAGLAKSFANGFKAAAGIRSPSRVFMGLGGHIMSGLNLGLADGEQAPVDRLTRLSAKMGAALAVGAAPAMLAAMPPPIASAALPPPLALPRAAADLGRASPVVLRTSPAAATAEQIVIHDIRRISAPASDARDRGEPRQRDTRPQLGPISITINQAPGQSAEDLAREIKRTLEELQRGERAARRSSYRDTDDV